MTNISERQRVPLYIYIPKEKTMAKLLTYKNPDTSKM